MRSDFCVISNVFPLYEQRWGTGDNLVCKAQRRFYRVGNQYKRRNQNDNPLLTRDKVFAGSSPPKFLEISSNLFWSERPWKCSAGGALTPPEFGTPPSVAEVPLQALKTTFS